VELGLVPLKGRAMLRKNFNQLKLSADGWGCIPVLLVVWPKASEVYWLLGTGNGSLWEGLWQSVLPRTTTTTVFVPTMSHSHPLALQETLQY